jgi:hypothetical protein
MTQAVYQRTALISLDELTPYPGNAKRGDVELILSSLRRNGQYRSLVVREIENGPLIILAGNHTHQALALHGPGPCEETVRVGGEERPCGICGNALSDPGGARCEVITCDDDTARRINLVDNRAADVGDYDADALAALLADLGDDFDGTGYDSAEVDRLMAPPDPAVPPEEFPAFDEEIETAYQCPKCSYSWSGKPR